MIIVHRITCSTHQYIEYFNQIFIVFNVFYHKLILLLVNIVLNTINDVKNTVYHLYFIQTIPNIDDFSPDIE